MLIEVFFLTLLVAAFFLTWGLKQKNPHFFTFGCIFVMITGILIFATGLQTNNTTDFTTTKSTVGTDVVYTTSITYQTQTTSNDFGIWALAWSMLLIPIVMIPAGLYLLPKIKSYNIG